MKKNIGTYAIIGIVTAGAALAGGQVAEMAGAKNLEPEQKEALHQAIESGDYATWNKLLPEDAKIREVITEENFAKLQTLHELRASGDTEAAQSLQEELGLPGKHHRGEKQGKENREEMKAALESQDYEAFVALLPEQRQEEFHNTVSKEDFSEFVRMHELREAGDFEAAEEIRELLGLPEHPERADKEAHKEQHEALHTAAENGDYDGFVELLPEDRQEEFTEKISADQFDDFVLMQELRKAGDKEGAEEIREFLGLEEDEMRRPRKNHGRFNKQLQQS